jgi:predicted nucleic acid-binding protein
MTVSIDTNIIAALWNDRDPFNTIALKLLHRVQSPKKLAIPGPVYAELMPVRCAVSRNWAVSFMKPASISIGLFDERVWREAGRAYRGYTQRHHSSDKSHPRRMLTDFLIGAHAYVHGHTLLTLDERLFGAAFPRLKIISN